MANDLAKFKTLIGEFFNELLLFSGQYALFYVLMNFTDDRLNYFLNFGHTLLLLILLLQTAILVKFGTKLGYRFLGSLIAPFVLNGIGYERRGRLSAQHRSCLLLDFLPDHRSLTGLGNQSRYQANKTSVSSSTIPQLPPPLVNNG
jgi:hypothetical protein